MSASFRPQPYPLFAVTIERADDPIRFQLTDEPIRLVLGWSIDDQGQVTPHLAGGGPAGSAWTGPVLYAETRERAEQASKEVVSADRAVVRESRWREVLAWLDRSRGR